MTSIFPINSLDSTLGEPFSISTSKPSLNVAEWQIDKYTGLAPLKNFLVEGIFPMASVCLLGATGGVGKGMLLLDLALNVASPTSQNCAFGPKVPEHGSVVIFFAEDDKDEIHRRLNSLDSTGIRHTLPNDHQIYLVPLPNAGGAFSIIENSNGELKESGFFQEIRQQLKKIKNLKLIGFDPLASFVRADINSDPAAGAFFMNILQEIATETKACVLVTHHTTKPPKDRGKTIDPTTVEDLYHSLRGTSALGNGARAVYVLGIAPKPIQNNVFKTVNQSPSRNSVYIGGIGKANGPADWEPQIFLRSHSGLLKNVTDQIKQKTLSTQEIEKLLLEAIADQEDKNAFTKTGSNGLFERRSELPPELQSLAKHDFPKLVDELLGNGKVKQYAKIGGKNSQYLGTPDGPLSQGIVEDKPAPILYGANLKELFLKAAFEAEKKGQPFNKGGVSTPWKRKGDIPTELQKLGQKHLKQIMDDCIEEKSIVLCIHNREKNPQWLGSPNGLLTADPENYEFRRGSV